MSFDENGLRSPGSAGNQNKSTIYNELAKAKGILTFIKSESSLLIPEDKVQEEKEHGKTKESIKKAKSRSCNKSLSTNIPRKASEDIAKAAKSLTLTSPLSKSLVPSSSALHYSRCERRDILESPVSLDHTSGKSKIVSDRKESKSSDNKPKVKAKRGLSLSGLFTSFKNLYDESPNPGSAFNRNNVCHKNMQNEVIKKSQEVDTEDDYNNEEDEDDIGKLKMGKSVISLLTTTSIYSEFNKLGLKNHSDHNFSIEGMDYEKKTINNIEEDNNMSSDDEYEINKTEETNFFDQINIQEEDNNNAKKFNIESPTARYSITTTPNETTKPDLKDVTASLENDVTNPFVESVIKSLHSKRNLICNHLKASVDIKNHNKVSTSANESVKDGDDGIIKRRAIALTEKMIKVFQIDIENDELIDDFSCWLLRDVLLQGHLYVTKQYLLFFAYLPNKEQKNKTYLKLDEKTENKTNVDDSDFESSNDRKIIMKGNLTVSKGKKNAVAAAVASTFENSHLVMNRRYWCILRYSTFSVYNNSTDLYFPVYNINLKTIQRVDVLYRDASKYDNEDEDRSSSELNSLQKNCLSKPSSPLSKEEKSPSRVSSPLLSADIVAKTAGSSKLDPAGPSSTYESLAIIDQIKERNIKTRSRSGSTIKDDSNTDALNLIIKPHKFKIVTTDNRSFVFVCDSLTSATNWVSHIKTQIFTLNNKSNEIVIKLPISNIFDLEVNLIFENAHNIRLKVLENSSSYALDDYFFLFFNSNSLFAGKNNCHDFVNSINKAATLNEGSLLLNKESFDKRALIAESQKAKKQSKIITDNYFPSTQTIKETQTILLEKDSAENKILEGDSEFIKRGKSYVFDYGSKALNVLNPKNLMKNVITQRIQNGIEMWSSNPIHYEKIRSSSNENNDADVDDVDDKFYEDSEVERAQAVERFRNYFSLPKSERLVASYFAYLQRNIPLYGKIYIGNSKICFRGLLPGSSTKMILPFADVENCYNEKNFSFGYSGLVLVINGHEELFFEFSANESRDDCGYLILKQLDFFKHVVSEKDTSYNNSSNSSNENCGRSVMLSSSYSSASLNTFFQVADLKKNEDKINRVQAGNSQVPIIIKDLTFSKPDSIKPTRSYKFVCLTIGSRGDVQPYIALCKQLIKEGHSATIATHGEFKEFVESRGILFKEIAGNPTELMAFMGNYSTISVSFIKDAKAKFSKWIDELLKTSWSACIDADVDILIESPSAMAGIHIAEALNIPYFEAFTMPWTRTRAYPHAFIVPELKKGGSYNYFTHVMFENLFWKGISNQVNHWRVKTLSLPKTDLYYLQRNKVPFLYNISPTVFPPSVDFADWISVTGYWFLDEQQNYTPPNDLIQFIRKAREDNKKLVYIGFGSIVVSDPKQLTEAIIEAVSKADVRCILNKGWSGRLESVDNKELEVELPHTGEVYNAGSLPHDWLFTKIDVAVHHGGSGTTGASLRAGLPTIVKPFFGDQFFYAHRVEDMNVGVYLRKLNPDSLAKAIKKCCIDQRIIEKARSIGEKIRNEKGVHNAITEIYSQLDYAQSIISIKREQSMKRLNSGSYFRHNSPIRFDSPKSQLISGIPGITLEQPIESDVSSKNVVVSRDTNNSDHKGESLTDKLHSLLRRSSQSIKKPFPSQASKIQNNESWVLL